MRRIGSGMVAMVLLVGAGCITEETMDPEASLYGRIKADVMYDTASMNGNSTQYVKNVPRDDRLSVTSRESRLGVKFSQGESLSGKLEVDLYGGTVKDAASGDTSAPPENKPTVLLRHLFVRMKLTDQMSVLAGQTSDVFSPLLPAVLNYGWGWNCGNPGYRRPQVRFEYSQMGITAQVAAARGIGAEDSAAVDWQARVAYALEDEMGGKPKVVVGASFVQGYADADREGERTGTAVDFQLNDLIPGVVLRGEWFTGENLKPYLAGIAQDVPTTGMWLQAGVKLTDKLSLNLGWLFDDPDDDEVAAGGRLKNEGVFLNVRGKLNAKTEVGVEVFNWNTFYDVAGEEAGYDSTRISASLIFVF